MSIAFWVKVVGWAMAGLPLAVALAVSFYMIVGSAGDDDTMKTLVMLGVSIFLVGVILLAVSYFTDLFTLFV